MASQGRRLTPKEIDLKEAEWKAHKETVRAKLRADSKRRADLGSTQGTQGGNDSGERSELVRRKRRRQRRTLADLVRSSAWAPKGGRWIVEPRDVVARADLGDPAAAKQVLLEMRAAFSARAEQPIRQEYRRYLAKALSKVLDGASAADAFNLRGPGGRHREEGKVFRELLLAQLFLKVRASRSHAIAKKIVADKFNVSEKTVEAAVTRWTSEGDGKRKLVFSPRSKVRKPAASRS